MISLRVSKLLLNIFGLSNVFKDMTCNVMDFFMFSVFVIFYENHQMLNCFSNILNDNNLIKDEDWIS